MQSIIALRVKEIAEPILQLGYWVASSYSPPSPAFIKRSVLSRNAIQSAPWIETGTYLGGTTKVLAKRFPKIISIEPSAWLYKHAQKRLSSYQNVKIVNNTSEESLSKVFDEIEGRRINLWLDGHYSSGVTYLGDAETPIMKELEIVGKNLTKFDHIKIFIDDVRCFVEGPSRDHNYPAIDVLVEWCRTHKGTWHIEHDIFVAEFLR